MVSYEPFWRTLKEKKISTYALIHKRGVNPKTLQNIRDNEGMSLHTLEKLCKVLACGPMDIFCFKESDTEVTESKGKINT